MTRLAAQKITGSSSTTPWQLWIDTGGTFTDCIATDPDGKLHRLKILSSSVLRGKVVSQPDVRTLEVAVQWPIQKDIFHSFVLRVVGTAQSATVQRIDLIKNLITLTKPLKAIPTGTLIELTTNEEVPVLAARFLTQTPIGQSFPALEVKLGSTRGTNAILERKGAATAFLVTRGFKDLLLIGNQQRPDLFTLRIEKPKPLYKLALEVNERIASDGSVILPLDSEEVQSLIANLKKKKIQSVAVALVNAYKNPAHEKMLADALRAAGFEYVSTSHELSTQIKILNRAETTVANAYLDPIIHSYVSGIQHGLSGARLSIMTSSGGLVRADSFFPKDSLLSGPAGGVVGAAHQALRSGVEKILAFDMGGTSTDVSMYNGRFDYRFESRIGSFSILSPSLAIETIAAGGGSICDFDGHRLTVGPHSAGANPGPACYGANGPLAITDVNLLLGRMDPDQFTIPIQRAASEKALKALLTKLKRQTRRDHNPVEVMESLLQIANEKMAEAIRKISVQQGHDPRDFSLLSFGGAGGQHACALAAILGMKRILIPYDAGLLSAYGIGHAAIERLEEKLVLEPWKDFEPHLESSLNDLFEKAKNKFHIEGHSLDLIEWKSSLLFARFTGQDSSIEIEFHVGDSLPNLFKKRYKEIYGHWTDREIEVESVRVIAAIKETKAARKLGPTRHYKPEAKKIGAAIAFGKRIKCPIYRWEDLTPGAEIGGPALVSSGNSTTYVEPSWRWILDATGNGHMAQDKEVRRGHRHSREGELELFTNRFTAVAQEMGALLQRTSFSVNIKERLDFSCALLDADGYLVVNAPHIPVHLGSMGVCVREVCEVIAMNEGDVIVTNHPAFGGSHLPDVTLIKPVFFKKKLVGYVANRAHHAEIGGSKPGSMPANATRLGEEGVIISPAYLVKNGKPQWGRLTEILSKGKFPTRSLDENLADLNGALASVNLGEKGLQSLCERYGRFQVVLQMKALRQYASALLAKKISLLPRKPMSATEYLDDGSALRVRIARKGARLQIDFTGSSAVHKGNLNATKAIVQSVVLYCLRLLVNQSLPMNEGLMEQVTLILPNGLLNPDFTKEPLPAVVGGNTEVSQRLTDTVLKALGLAACSQGTMNNFLFGNSRFGYYETICGGVGAVEGFDGADAVHQHMTNTRITDPEVLEFRYPVRLERFEIRRGSGGKGKWNGGDGVLRQILFCEELEINLLTQHRKQKPYGMKGGGSGKIGEQIVQRRNAVRERLSGVDRAKVVSGDRLLIATPGGGGWGRRTE